MFSSPTLPNVNSPSKECFQCHFIFIKIWVSNIWLHGLIWIWGWLWLKIITWGYKSHGFAHYNTVTFTDFFFISHVSKEFMMIISCDTNNNYMSYISLESPFHRLEDKGTKKSARGNNTGEWWMMANLDRLCFIPTYGFREHSGY
jgi:hypothetical protein